MSNQEAQMSDDVENRRATLFRRTQRPTPQRDDCRHTAAGAIHVPRTGTSLTCGISADSYEFDSQ
jgi:hypothetical protein